MTNEVQQTKPRRFFKPKFNGIEYLWAVYPDYWKRDWGPVPLLGYVRADNEFLAEREAYDKGLLTLNYTFKPKVVMINSDRSYSNTKS